MNILSHIATAESELYMRPMILCGANFVPLFQWLSDSFKIIADAREGEKIDVTPAANNNTFRFDV